LGKNAIERIPAGRRASNAVLVGLATTLLLFVGLELLLLVRSGAGLPGSEAQSSYGAVVLGITLSLIVAGIVKGAIGVGMPIVAMPLLVLAVDVQTAVILLTLPLIITNIPQALEGGDTRSTVRNLAFVIVGLIPGLLFGVYILMHMSVSLATGCAGAVLMFVGIIMITNAKIEIASANTNTAGVIAGFCGGILGGIAALPGPIVFVYLIGKGLRGAAFTKEASMFLVIASAVLAIVLGSSQHIGAQEWGLSLAALLPVSAGMLLGQRLRGVISPEVFKRLVLVTVILSGLGLIKTGWTSQDHSAHASTGLRGSVSV